MDTMISTFLGNSPMWFKRTIIAFLLLNIVLFLFAGPAVTGWAILIEFIFCLAMALKCYPLLPGGLIAMEAVIMGLVTPEGVYHEIEANLEVLLLLLFMVAGIHFMKDLLSWIFTRLLVGVKSKMVLSLTFSFAGAFLSAWLDALTVTAVLIAVGLAFYNIYVNSSLEVRVPGNKSEVEKQEIARDDLEQFAGFLRNLIMHGVIGTALGGVATQVGEPQNLLIATKMKWTFVDFYVQMAHITIPVLFAGLFVVWVVEKFSIFDYGYKLPDRVLAILKENMGDQKEMSAKQKYLLWTQGLAALWLILALAFHLAAVGLIGLSVIIILTSLNGKNAENTIGHAFEEATPFLSLLMVFFAIVAMIEETHIFKPIIDYALAKDGDAQILTFFAASGILSVISDNVFVATIYIKEAYAALAETDWEQLEKVAVAINVGTNIPSVGTPNGQAALLFLLTNALAGRLKLSYLKMMIMAFPYFVVLTIVATIFLHYDWFPW